MSLYFLDPLSLAAPFSPCFLCAILVAFRQSFAVLESFVCRSFCPLLYCKFLQGWGPSRHLHVWRELLHAAGLSGGFWSHFWKGSQVAVAVCSGFGPEQEATESRRLRSMNWRRNLCKVGKVTGLWGRGCQGPVSGLSTAPFRKLSQF